MREQGLELLELQLDKVVQLYETMMTRHTTMIVGPTGGGKTVCLGAMCRAQTISNLPTKQFIINPKAIPISELYGVLDPVTRDWTGARRYFTREHGLPGSSNLSLPVHAFSFQPSFSLNVHRC